MEQKTTLVSGADEGRLGYAKALADRDRKNCMALAAAVIRENSRELVAVFYSALQKNEEAAAFLNQSIVQERLSQSLADWLGDLARIDPCSDLAAFEARQTVIGEVHARIKVPVHLVLEGASLLKREISIRLAARTHSTEAFSAIILFGEIIDFAIGIMSKAYGKRTGERIRVDEAYRLYSLGQDVGVERESQKSMLMEWSQSVLFRLFGQQQQGQFDSISASPFGLWVRHRGAVMFEGSIMLRRIEAAMQEIDNHVIPNMRRQKDVPAQVQRLQVLIEEVKYLLNDLFESLTAAANARDALTSALTRRFLPSILGREVQLANRQGTPLSLLMLDVDHFKQINDTWGHSGGDAVLRQIAEVIFEHIRPSDFLFRYGGEEFLLVLVEADRNHSFKVAESIRLAFEARQLDVAEGRKTRATVSVGIAIYDGHPDFQRLIDTADRAMYEAKALGRNRSVIA